MTKFPHYKQPDTMDCGPTSLRIVTKYYGRHYNLHTLRELAFKSREGISLLSMSDAAEKIGFRTNGASISFEQLKKAILPCILYWNQNHFVVIYKIKKDIVYISDPAIGLVKYSKKEFLISWATTKEKGEKKGIALFLEPTPDFYIEKGEKPNKAGFGNLLNYIRPYRKLIIQLLLGFLTGSLLGLIFPFLTQAIVDVGITTNNLNFVVLVLIAQLVLTFSQTVVGFVRSWIMLHVSIRVGISLISDFLIKLMRLPISFFDTKMIGDLRQRIDDNQRVQSFLTGSFISMSFGLFMFVIYSFVMAYYDWRILLIFYGGSILYVFWILLFLKKRKEIDYKRFSVSAANQSNVYQLITGMQEIKLNSCEKQKRWEWEGIQARLFRVSIKGLILQQNQQGGSVFIDQSKNILISFITAQAVIEGNLTLGMMMSVQYIIGQLNGPINEFIGFIRAAQDAKISLERLGEIHNREDEESINKSKIDQLPEQKELRIENVSFHYEGPRSPRVLNNINLSIPENKITAIVGTSGSGKTTLLKLLLGFYPPNEGKISLGDIDFQQFSMDMWRKKCGTVMQDGYIFSDTIANNIAVADDFPDKDKLLHAVTIANIRLYIEGLPLRYNTKIGQEGKGLSQGQKQRILIARAVYKNPDFLFMDEATNALDANNEEKIMYNLNDYFKEKTVITVAHRLSTVKNADQIVVLEKGKIIELGTHTELVNTKGAYYKLVKNQLELGS